MVDCTAHKCVFFRLASVDSGFTVEEVKSHVLESVLEFCDAPKLMKYTTAVG